METEIRVIKRAKETAAVQNAPLSAAPEEGMPLLDFVLLLAEHKRLLLRITAAFAVTGLVLAFVLPVRYTAKVEILPPREGSSVGSYLSSQLGELGTMAALMGSGGALGLKNPNDMYVAMLKSQTVEDAMIQRFDLMKEYHSNYLSDARKAFERRASIEGGLRDGLIHISFEDTSSARAAQIANAYVDEFRFLSQHLAITEASRRRQFFEQQVDDVRNKLKAAEDSLEASEEHTGVIQMDSQARALIESAAMLRAQIAAKEVQIQGMKSYATGENAAMEEALQQLAGMRTQLSKLVGSGDTADAGLIVPKGKIPEAGLEYMRKLRDLKYYEAEYTLLARQLELAKLDEAREGAMIQVVDPARPPDKRSSPKRLLIVLTAMLSGLMLGILAALLNSHLEQRSDDPIVQQKLARLKKHLQLWKRQTQERSSASIT